jgi:hypothetical protein
MSALAQPTFDRAQSMSALQRANEVRLAGARFKRQVAQLEQREALARVARLVASPRELGVMRVEHVLMACPRIGHDKCRALLLRARIQASGAIRLRDLTDRQRDDLCGLLLDPARIWPCGRLARDQRGARA